MGLIYSQKKGTKAVTGAVHFQKVHFTNTWQNGLGLFTPNKIHILKDNKVSLQ